MGTSVCQEAPVERPQWGLQEHVRHNRSGEVEHPCGAARLCSSLWTRGATSSLSPSGACGAEAAPHISQGPHGKTSQHHAPWPPADGNTPGSIISRLRSSEWERCPWPHLLTDRAAAAILIKQEVRVNCHLGSASSSFLCPPSLGSNKYISTLSC